MRFSRDDDGRVSAVAITMGAQTFEARRSG